MSSLETKKKVVPSQKKEKEEENNITNELKKEVYNRKLFSVKCSRIFILKVFSLSYQQNLY